MADNNEEKNEQTEAAQEVEETPEASVEGAESSDDAQAQAEEAQGSAEESASHGGSHDHAAPAFKGGHGEDADGMVAFFAHPNEILDAAAVARDQEFTKWDVYTPFPIHGMDDAMGIGRSWLPYVTFVAALTGTTTALLIQTGTMTVDWPMIIGGKPFFPWPSFMPVTFELSVLLSGLTTVLVMFWAAGLPNFKPKVIDPSLTRDKFGLWVSSEDPQYDPVKTREFLEGLHPEEIREVRFDA